MARKRSRLQVNVRFDLEPHPLDEEIRDLVRRLRRLVHQRGHYFKGSALRGKKQAPEHIAQRIAKVTGKKQDPAVVERRAAKLRGLKRTPAQRARISQAMLALQAQKRAAA